MKRTTQIQIQNLMDAIQESAIEYGDGNIRHYAKYSREKLIKWARNPNAGHSIRGGMSLQQLAASDSLFSEDIIDQMMSAAHDFAQLINV